MPEQRQSSGLMQRIGAWFQGHDPRLNVPPEPPLLTTDAVHAVLREVGLLLDYLNRQAEPRLNRYFDAAAFQALSKDELSRAPIPPCTDLGYFLGRIAAIAAQGRDGEPTATTQPRSFKEPSPENGDGASQGEAAGTLPGSRLGDLAFLIWARDFLTSVAAPATLDTIRVTRAYRAYRATGAVATEEKSRHTTDERDLFMSRYGYLIGRRVGRFMLLAIFLLWCSLYVSYLVYTGQSLLQENAALRTEYAAHEVRVKEAAAQEETLVQAALRTEPVSDVPLEVPLLAFAYCSIFESPSSELKAELVRIAGSPTAERTTAVGTSDRAQLAKLRLYVSERQRGLCTEHQVLNQRRRELVDAHSRWWSHAILMRRITQPDEFLKYLNPWYWLQSSKTDLSPSRPSSTMSADRAEVRNSSDRVEARSLSERTEVRSSDRPNPRNWHLETFRYRMQHMINGLLAGIMPAMYAALGALASLLRRLSQKVEAERLAPADYGGMASSLVLGILTGAVIGLFMGAMPQAGQGTALPLSTTALALLAGYATDRVFGMFDHLADRVFVVSDTHVKPAA